MPKTGSVDVKLLGIFEKAYGKSHMSVTLETPRKLRDVIMEIADSSPNLRRALIDPELHDPRPNAVILVNGKEINALEGLETEIRNQDKIVIIPVAHGG